MAKRIILDAQGDPSVLKLKTVELQPPGPGEVRLRQTAIGVNYMDVYQRSGAYPLDLPSGLGLEAVGVVEEVGKGAIQVNVGDRVAYAGGPPGSYTSHRNRAADSLIKVPDSLSDEQVAAVLLKGMTVEYLLERCRRVATGDWVLFYAAAGGVGLLAGQWGQALGARMIGVAGGPEKCTLALDHGYEVVIDRTSENIAERVREITSGEGVPVAFDSVGKATFDATVGSLARRAMFVSFGASSGNPPDVSAKLLQQRGSLYFTRPTLADYVFSSAEDLQASAARVFDMLKAGSIKIDIGQRYPLAEAEQAHTDLEGARTKGSTVLSP
ncbi:MAG: quinone oxidoreductase family protein [Geminicoccaceae bacterium]